MDAARLYDVCAVAITAARARRWWRRRGPVLWLTAPTVTVGARVWAARRTRNAGQEAAYGFTLRQVTQIQQQLAPALAAYGTELEKMIRMFGSG